VYCDEGLEEVLLNDYGVFLYGIALTQVNLLTQWIKYYATGTQLWDQLTTRR
jgi:hypothetical protein